MMNMYKISEMVEAEKKLFELGEDGFEAWLASREDRPAVLERREGGSFYDVYIVKGSRRVKVENMIYSKEEALKAAWAQRLRIVPVDARTLEECREVSNGSMRFVSEEVIVEVYDKRDESLKGEARSLSRNWRGTLLANMTDGRAMVIGGTYPFEIRVRRYSSG